MKPNTWTDRNDGTRKPANPQDYANKLKFALALIQEHKANDPEHPLHECMYLPLCRWIDNHYPKVL